MDKKPLSPTGFILIKYYSVIIMSTMIFKDLLLTVEWLPVRYYLMEGYPETTSMEQTGRYEELFYSLQEREPDVQREDCYTIEVDYVFEEHSVGQSGYFHVNGRKPGCEDAYALELSPWAEWLGWNVRISPGMPEAEFVAHCLWEMTFFGFEESRIEEQRRILMERADEARAGEKWLTTDEVRQRLGLLDDGEDDEDK